MANALFDKARQRFLEGQFNWNTDTIKAVLVDTGTYTVNLSAHEFLSDIGTGARIATSGAFTGKTTTGGAADANDVTFTSVTGASIEAIEEYLLARSHVLSDGMWIASTVVNDGDTAYSDNVADAVLTGR